MKQIFAIAPLISAALAGQVFAGSTGFSSMSVGADQPASCEAPRPPADLNPSAYVRNGYRVILQIMAAERWQETGSCECFVNKIAWEEVLVEAQNYVTSDNPLLPFKVADLRNRADQMIAARDAACAN